MQRWRPLGLVYAATGESDWLASHASYPTPLILPDGRLRVFFSPRDRSGRSSIFSLDLALHEDGFERVSPPMGPWLEPGLRGAYDDAGASVSCILPRSDGGIDCLYLGWNLGVSVPFRTAIGLATAGPGETRLRRASPAPMLDRSSEDPFVLGYPWALNSLGSLWLWYGTHLSWGTDWLENDHAIRRATRGADGIWQRDAKPCLRPAGGEEFALSRPCVLRDSEGWHMWYCRRFKEYRLGYARSADGVMWARQDGALCFDGKEEVRTYPAVLDHSGRRYMLYNGDGYGRSGFSLAVLEG